MKRIFIIFILSIYIIPINVGALNINSKNVVMYNLNDDKVIYSIKPNEEISIASMTKIMTCVVALEHINNIDEKFVMTKEMFNRLVEENASVAGFRVGEEVTYRDLLYGLMLPSGADAAQGLAIKISGSVDNFVELMNNKAKELKLKHTNYVNPTGLDNKKHYSSVSDVAKVLKYALQNKDFKKIFTTKKYTTSNKRHVFKSTIDKVNMDTSFIKGSKTGFTYDAGLCMASISDYNNISYLLVTARASYNNRANHLIDAKNLYEHYFNNYDYIDVLKENELIKKININDIDIEYYNKDKVSTYLNKNCKIQKEYKEIKNENFNLFDKIGEYTIKCNDKVILTKDMYLNQIHGNIDKENNYIIIIILVITFGGMVLYGFLYRKRNRKRVKRKNTC